MIAGINSGIERINKFMMPLFFLLFLIMAIRVAFLPGAADGYRYLFIPQWEYLLKADTWCMPWDSASSPCPWPLGTVVYGSYLNDGEDCIVCARRIAIFDTLAAIWPPWWLSRRICLRTGPLLRAAPDVHHHARHLPEHSGRAADFRDLLHRHPLCRPHLHRQPV